MLDSLEFPVERTVALELAPPHNFHRAISPEHAAGQPNLPVCTFTDLTDQLMVRNAEPHGVRVVLGGHDSLSHASTFANTTPPAGRQRTSEPRQRANHPAKD